MLTKCKRTFTLKYSHLKKQKMHTEVKSPRSGPSQSIAELRWRRQACMVGALFVLYREKNCAVVAALNRAAQLRILVVCSVCTGDTVTGQYSSVPRPVLLSCVLSQYSSVPRPVLLSCVLSQYSSLPRPVL